MPDGSGNEAQVRIVAEQVADAAITRFAAAYPDRVKPPKIEATIPAPLRWAGVIVASLFTAGTATLVFWLVSSVSEMQVTLARMDERMASGTVKDARFDDIERRVTKLEGYHSNGGQE